jgi:DNA (cytosine-5)-methyltransferase 1
VKRHKSGESVFPNADIVTGGFPCTDFSLSGKRKGIDSDKDHSGKKMESGVPSIENRGMLYFWMKEVIEIVKPKVFIAENVGGLNSLPKVLEKIQEDFSDAGYKVQVKTLYSPDYGVPQTRTRIIFIGLRKDVEFSGEFKYPEKTHCDQFDCETLFGSKLIPYVSCQEAFLGLQEPEDSKDISQQSLSKAKYYGLSKTGNTMQGQNEVNLNEPGPTIRAEHHGNIEFRRLSEEHGGQNSEELAKGMKERRLTVRECARLQTFPDEYEFVFPGGSVTNGYRGVGNAVPPLLAYHIAQSLKNIWPKDV